MIAQTRTHVPRAIAWAFVICFMCAMTGELSAQLPFKRGDVNGDGEVNLADGLPLTMGPPFGPPFDPPCVAAADVDGNGNFNPLLDSLSLINYLSAGGPPPPSPGPWACGADPNLLSCLSYDSCDVDNCTASFGVASSFGAVPFEAVFQALEIPDASYTWSFGDGATETTNVPFVAHSYVDEGSYDVTLVVTRGSCSAESFRAGVVLVTPENPGFVRGKVTVGAGLGLTDVLFILNYLFTDGPTPACLSAADVNDDGALSIGDGLYALNYLFVGGPVPPLPFATCGADPTGDGLSCTTVCP